MRNKLSNFHYLLFKSKYSYITFYTIYKKHKNYLELLKREFICFFSLLFIGKLNYMARSLVKCTIFATDYESLKNFDAKIIMRLPYKFLNLRHATFNTVCNVHSFIHSVNHHDYPSIINDQKIWL